MKRSANRWLKWVVYYPVLVLVCFELAARIMGCGTFYVDEYSVEASPGNAYIGHPNLGIQLNPGEYHITLNRKIHFTATHQKNGSRTVRSCPDPTHPEVVFFGCSYTYGYGVDDDQNFVSLLQQSFPNTSLHNAGVIGYGTVQSLLQLEEALEGDSLKAVILDFSSFHFMRNGLSPVYRSNLKIGYQNSSSDVGTLMSTARFPYKPSCDEPIGFEAWENMYYNWPGREWLASVNWTQLIIDKVKKNRIDEVDIARCLIQEMANLCDQHGVAFGVVCLDRSTQTEELHERLTDLPWLDTDFNFSSEQFTNLPDEGHPNAEGHQLLASKIHPFLAQLLHED